MKVLRHRLVEDDGTPFPFERSPNSGGEVEHDLLVMHYTAGRSAESSVEWFKNPLANASSHLVVGRDGGIVQVVPFDRVAWHAGISEWQGRSGVNRFSLGIELDNAGKLMPHGERWRAWFGKEYEAEDLLVATHRNEAQEAGWHLFTEAQLEAAVTVASVLVDRYGLRDVVGHDDVAPFRKVDPGPAFPMASFRARVLGRQHGEPEVLETSNTLNIRVGPGTQFETLREGPLPPGTRVEVLERFGLWCLVDVLEIVGDVMDLQGWVHGRYLRRPAS
jgi:N-acetylmuramoyl-L-alanine amidase